MTRGNCLIIVNISVDIYTSPLPAVMKLMLDISSDKSLSVTNNCKARFSQEKLDIREDENDSNKRSCFRKIWTTVNIFLIKFLSCWSELFYRLRRKFQFSLSEPESDSVNFPKYDGMPVTSTPKCLCYCDQYKQILLSLCERMEEVNLMDE